jgi:hypothetical protein
MKEFFIMYEYRVGMPYSPTRTSRSDAGEYNYRARSHELRLFFSNLSRADVRAVSNGPADFALLMQKDVLFFLYRFGEAVPWSDAPYSLHKVAQKFPDEASLPPTELAGKSVLLNILLIEATTGIIQAVRVIGFPSSFSQALHEAIRKTWDAPFSEASYNAQIDEAYRLYPHTMDMVKAAQHRCMIPAR